MASVAKFVILMPLFVVFLNLSEALAADTTALIPSQIVTFIDKKDGNSVDAQFVVELAKILKNPQRSWMQDFYYALQLQTDMKKVAILQDQVRLAVKEFIPDEVGASSNFTYQTITALNDLVAVIWILDHVSKLPTLNTDDLTFTCISLAQNLLVKLDFNIKLISHVDSEAADVISALVVTIMKSSVGIDKNQSLPKIFDGIDSKFELNVRARRIITQLMNSIANFGTSTFRKWSFRTLALSLIISTVDLEYHIGIPMRDLRADVAIYSLFSWTGLFTYSVFNVHILTSQVAKGADFILNSISAKFNSKRSGPLSKAISCSSFLID